MVQIIDCGTLHGAFMGFASSRKDSSVLHSGSYRLTCQI